MIRPIPSAFVVLIALLAGACAPGPDKAPAAPQTVVPSVDVDLGEALTLVDGLTVRLGMTGDEISAAIDGTCVAKSRFDGGTGAPGELLCLLKSEDASNNRVLRIALSKMESGHRAWRIEYERRRGEGADSPVIKDLTDRYGDPRSVHVPFEMWWRSESQNLRLIGETSGLRFQLWDRSLDGNGKPRI